MKLNNRLFIYTFLVTLLTSTASVQTVKAVALSPLTFELVANPGDTVKNVIKVTNTESVPVSVDIDVDDFSPVGEEGQVTLEDPSESSTYSLAGWVLTDPSVFILKGGESRAVEFTINVPQNAEPGGHYSSVLATVTSIGTEEGGGSSIVQKVGSLLLVNVAGDVLEQLNIAEFSVPRFSEYGPITILSRFENEGSVHLKPRGFIHIANIFGREVAQLDLPQKNVLPRSIRRIEVPWGDKIMFGRYEATLTAIYGAANQPVSSVTSFWVIPWKIVTAVAVGLILMLSILIKGRKRIRLAMSVLFRGTHRLQSPN